MIRCNTIRLMLATCGLGITVAACGQSRTPMTAEAAQPTDMATLLQMQQSLDQPYRLGRGDTLQVVVQGRPELTGRQIVGPDGDVTMPLAGTIPVADKTRDEAANAIRNGLLPFYTDPAVTVGVEVYGSNRVLLVGSVQHPGPQLFDRPPTLLEVLSRGGNVTRNSLAGSAGQGGSGGGDSGNGPPLPDRVVIYRGPLTAITVDVKGLIRSGSMIANLRLQRDDVVFVPSGNDKYISVLGQVQRPGSLPIDDETSLPRLLAQAGGLTREAGRNPSIRVIDPVSGASREVEFKDLLKAKITDVPLHSGDIIFVPMSGFNSTTYVLDRLSPLVNMFTAAALFQNVSN